MCSLHADVYMLWSMRTMSTAKDAKVRHLRLRPQSNALPDTHANLQRPAIVKFIFVLVSQHDPSRLIYLHHKRCEHFASNKNINTELSNKNQSVHQSLQTAVASRFKTLQHAADVKIAAYVTDYNSTHKQLYRADLKCISVQGSPYTSVMAKCSPEALWVKVFGYDIARTPSSPVCHHDRIQYWAVVRKLLHAGCMHSSRSAYVLVKAMPDPTRLYYCVYGTHTGGIASLQLGDVNWNAGMPHDWMSCLKDDVSS